MNIGIIPRAGLAAALTDIKIFKSPLNFLQVSTFV